MNRFLKDALIGAVGGAAGTYVIGQVMGALSKVQSKADKNLEKALIREDPKERLARRISKTVFHKKLSPEMKAKMGHVVHWSYGTFWGGVYGVLRKRYRFASWGAGLPFGVGFALFGEALMLPLMKLTPPARRFPVSSHMRGLVSHWAYAATAECVGRTLDRIAGQKQLRTKTELRRVS